MRPAREGRENGGGGSDCKIAQGASMRPAREGRENALLEAAAQNQRRRFNEARP